MGEYMEWKHCKRCRKPRMVIELKDNMCIHCREKNLEEENAKLKTQVENLKEELSASEIARALAEEEQERTEATLTEVVDELNETTDRLEATQQRLDFITAQRDIAVEDMNALVKVEGYADELQRRATDKIKLEEMCEKEREEKMRQEAEEEKRHGRN